jgi:hypothetical protein
MTIGGWSASGIPSSPGLISDKAKEEACLAVLHVYIDVMAHHRIA